MPSEKATWYSLTVYNDEIAKMKDEKHYPEWVKKVFGGVEECPTSGKLHFQGALQCHQQVRFSKIKEWLPTAHIEVARSATMLAKYVMKDATAVEQKLIRENPRKFLKLHEICKLIYANIPATLLQRQTDRQTMFWAGVNACIYNDPDSASQMANPGLPRFFERTFGTWERLALPDNTVSITRVIHPECYICMQRHDPELDRCPPDEEYECDGPTYYALRFAREQNIITTHSINHGSPSSPRPTSPQSPESDEETHGRPS